MRIDLDRISKFAKPFYREKDIMHDWSHIERIEFTLEKLVEEIELDFDLEVVKSALFFHGIIYSHEEMITKFLKDIGVKEQLVRQIVKVSWESQKESKPETNEGLILHDAHMLEGGKNFEIVKSLITGSVRGQSLEETMTYIEKNLLKKGACYTEIGKKKYEVIRKTTKRIYKELCEGLGIEIDPAT